MPDKTRSKSEVKNTLKVLGIMVGTISVISFSQRIFDVGLIAVERAVVEYYREIANLIFAAPMELLGIKVPATLTDIWALSFVGALAYTRTPKIELSRIFRNNPRLTKIKHWKILLFFIFGITGIGLFVLVGAFSPTTYADDFHEEPLDLSKGAARNALYIFGGALAFFVLNAFAPSA